MLHNGFKNVFHLEGGIIHYANKVREENLSNKFKGKNFVFDDRLGEKIGNEVISNCHQCGSALILSFSAKLPFCAYQTARVYTCAASRQS